LNNESIFHLVPGDYFNAQPPDQPYTPAAFQAEGFIHCTAGVAMLLQVANAYFVDAPGPLLALQIDPQQLAAPLKFEPPIAPPGAEPRPHEAGEILFPHIYGPLNREAITAVISLPRNDAGQWQWPA
jgi:uncharacterized protein (DUF952 family)